MKKQHLLIKTFDFISILIFIILSIFFLKPTNFIGEVYLNYTDGFIRRGFLGTIIYIFDLLFKFDPSIFSTLLNFITKLLLLIVLLYYSFKLKIPKYLIFSYPVLFTGMINSGTRLDIILVLLFIVNFSLLMNNKSKYYLYFIVALIGILIHEVYYFMIIVPNIILLITKRNKQYLINIALFTLIFIIIILFYKGNFIQATNILNNWIALNFNPNFKYVFRDLVSNSTFYITDSIKTLKQFIGFFINNIICISFIIFSYFTSENNVRKRHFFSIIIFLQNIIFLFLCFIAVDYSRWYFILFTSVVYFYFMFSKELETNFPSLPYEINFLKINNSTFLFLSFILYLIISIPFSGWEFNQYFNSHLYFKIKAILLNI